MTPTAEATAQAGLSWEELCTNPHYAFLNDLPFKVETNEWGQIVMSPTRFQHGFYQKRLARLLDDLHPQPGESVTEPAIETAKGVKVADVAWFSADHVREAWEQFAVRRAPEICVEVLSPWNAWGEIEQKVSLYLDAGAAEVWVCDLEGRLHFFDRDGRRDASARVPGFPARIEG
jgi:Uma2 family endonuclease